MNRTINIYTGRSVYTAQRLLVLLQGLKKSEVVLNGPGFTDTLTGEHVDSFAFINITALEFNKVKRSMIVTLLKETDAIKNFGAPLNAR